MIPRIEILSEKKLVGMRLTMSLAHYNIAALWRSFTPRRKEIRNNLTSDLISMVVYSPRYFEDFDVANDFERWAVVEVSDFGQVPSGMDTFVLQGGLYAIFDYKGLSTDHSIFQYILGTWLPSSDYVLDDRPHFEVLGDRYRNNDPNSEEEIWIPIRVR